jgi:hypothetical protein
MTVNFLVAVNLPDVPLMVSVLVPASAVVLALSVNTLVPEVGFVLHDAVTPLGSEEVKARLTLPLNSSAPVTVMVVVADVPCRTETVGEDAPIQKPGTCFPAKASIRFCPFALPQPVTRS